MKPIPAPSNPEDNDVEQSPSSASNFIKSYSLKPNHGNRRSTRTGIDQAYPWLLVASTAISVFFGIMYIEKDVIVSSSGSDKADTAGKSAETSTDGVDPSLLPSGDRLPGEAGAGDNAGSTPTHIAPIHSRYEETNLRVQHIMTATSANGSISRIDLEVPVLYQSRKLRWTPREVAQAEDLMVQLIEYQDKSRQLRSQGERLLNEWNVLIGQSIPATSLRADSPSIPDNQKGSMVVSDPAETTAQEASDIKPKDKP